MYVSLFAVTTQGLFASCQKQPPGGSTCFLRVPSLPTVSWCSALLEETSLGLSVPGLLTHPGLVQSVENYCTIEKVEENY